MKKSLLALTIAMAFAVSAQAANNNSNNGPDTTSTSTANAGAVGVGVGIGIAGAQAQVGNTTATGGAATGGAATGGNATGGSVGDVRSSVGNVSGGTVLGSGNSAVGVDVKSTGGAGGSVGDTKTGDITIGGSTYTESRRPVNTAYSNLAAPSAPCMGSSSVGGSGAAISFSVGTTWESEKCNDREDVRTAHNYGDPEVAEQMLVDKITGYAAAKEKVEARRAEQAKAKQAKAQTNVVATHQAPVKSRFSPQQYELASKQMNLPPLK